MPHRIMLLLALALAGCNGAKKAAQASIAAADSAVAAVQPEAERVAPELLQPVTTALTEAKAAFAEKDYEAALAKSQDIPTRAAEVATKVEERKKDSSTDFAVLIVAMPRNLAAMKQKLARPPRSLSRERVAEIQKLVDSASTEWDAITKEFQSGAVSSAMDKAFLLKARVSEAMVALGLSADEKAWGNLITQPK